MANSTTLGSDDTRAPTANAGSFTRRRFGAQRSRIAAVMRRMLRLRTVESLPRLQDVKPNAPNLRGSEPPSDPAIVRAIDGGYWLPPH